MNILNFKKYFISPYTFFEFQIMVLKYENILSPSTLVDFFYS